MIDPIRDRRPTKADGDSKWGDVLVYRDGAWSASFHGSVKKGEWWKPIDQTPPPEDPVSKRRTHRRVCGGEAIHYIEVLPGDPPDLDAFLAAFDKWVETPDKMSTYIDKVDAKSAMLKARQGEGGKE